MMNNTFTMLDLFAGAGGLSEGLSEAGFHSLFASEIVPVYANTYKLNHPGAKVFTADIRGSIGFGFRARTVGPVSWWSALPGIFYQCSCSQRTRSAKSFVQGVSAFC